MRYDSFSISLRAGLLPQGGFPHLFGDGSPQKLWQWAAVHPRPVCDVLLVSSCLKAIEVGVTSTLLCPEEVDVGWRDNLFFPLLLVTCVCFLGRLVIFCRQKKL